MKQALFLVLFSLFLITCSSVDDKNEATESVDTSTIDSSTEWSTDSSDTETGVVKTGPYSVWVNGAEQQVVRTENFAVPVNYVQLSHPGGTLEISITADSSVSSYTLSPKRLALGDSVSGNTISFSMSEAAYVILEIPGNERLFILVDPAEVNPPAPDGVNVINVATLEGIDSTGVTEVTEILQAAIDSASGAVKNVVYVPAGTYTTKALYLKDSMTLYLAKGALLKNATPAGDLKAHPASLGLTLIEYCSRGFIVMNGVNDAHIAGRGTIDANGAVLQGINNGKMFAVKIENSTNSTVDGIISRDSAFWNTLVYRSENIAITNYKVINNRLNNEWNETDGVDFDNCANSSLYNAFLYTGDDCMAVKSDDIRDEFKMSADPSTGDYIAVDNISHEKIVCYSGSSACKVGTKTFGATVSNISFTDVDVVTANRGLVIDAVDTADIIGTVFKDIRIENATGRLVDFNMDPEAINWRINSGICTVTDTIVTNVSSDVNKECRLGGNVHDWNVNDEYYGNEYFINGVAFTNFSILGNSITGVQDANASFIVNSYVTGITFAP